MVEASKMEVDLEDTTHESNAKTPLQINTLLILLQPIYFIRLCKLKLI